MVYTGSDAGDHASAPQPSGSGSVPASVNVPGLVWWLPCGLSGWLRV